MAETSLRLLVVDDERSLCDVLGILFRRDGWRPESAGTVREALDLLSRQRYDLVLSDLMIGPDSGLEIVRALASGGSSSPPIVLMTAYGTVEKAVEALKLGAADFILKPFQNETLIATVRQALERRHPGMVVSSPSVSSASRFPSGMLVGSSPAMTSLRQSIERVGPLDSTVLITGESGTGKELVARALHACSPRAARPFLAIHCAALPESLLESELFGHVRGAFTGATSDKTGLLVAAHSGTVFLDEIGEVPLSFQVKLLRALQEREVTPVGGTTPLKVEARILAATNADLEGMVERGTFRSDLYWRLNVIRLRTASLRERSADLAELTNALLAKMARRLGRPVPRLTTSALQRLSTHNFPGNIRELENLLERANALHPGETIEAEHLDLTPTRGRLLETVQPQPSLAEVERAYIFWTLYRCGWNLEIAADALRLPPDLLLKLLERYGLRDSSQQGG